MPIHNAVQQDPPVTLSGRVSDWHGCTIPEAVITVLDASGAVIATGKTGVDGQFDIAGLRPGLISLRAELAGFRKSERPQRLHAGVNVWDTGLALAKFTPTPVHRIAGTVSDTRGRLIANATVTLADVFSASVRAQVRTDSGGRYAIETEDSGQYVITAVGLNYRAASDTIVFAHSDGSSAAVHFRLRPEPACSK
jgi:hypothetical protein